MQIVILIKDLNIWIKKITQKNNVFLDKTWTISKPWSVHSSRYLWPKLSLSRFSWCMGVQVLLTPLAALFTWFFIPAGFTISHGHWSRMPVISTVLSSLPQNWSQRRHLVGATFAVKLTICHGCGGRAYQGNLICPRGSDFVLTWGHCIGGQPYDVSITARMCTILSPGQMLRQLHSWVAVPVFLSLINVV